MFIDLDPSDEEKSLGKYLKSIREDKEIRLDELSESTRIKQDYLEAIEADKFDELPEGPYLNLFLKSYAEALEIDYNKIAEYLEKTEAQPAPKQPRAKTAKPPKEKKKLEQKPQTLKPVVDIHEKQPQSKDEKEQSSTFNQLILIGILVFVAFIILIVVVVLSSRQDIQSEEPVAEVTTLPQEQAVVDSAQIRMRNFLAQYDSMTISIHPVSQQAISIVADGEAMTKLVNPNNVWEVSAAESLYVSTERMDGTRYYLNGFRIKTDSISLAGKNDIIFKPDNWVKFVDTTVQETENE